VVWVHSATAGELRLATNLPVADAPAELISVMYRRRWQIESFFKWLKCLLGCRHWLAESQRGVTVQLYLALIAAVILVVVKPF
jgi:IS4 transposase